MDSTLVLLALLVPLVAAVLIPLAGGQPNLREGITLASAGILFVIVASLVGPVLSGARPELGGFEVLPGLVVGFRVEPLGMLFGLVASTLWIVNSIYSIGYMRGNGEPRQTQFYVCFAVAIAATMGVAFSSNLFTLFLFYEVLTLSTYPLVTHNGNAEARAAGRVYLMLLLGTSMLLLLPAIIWTGILAGTLDFAPGGILAGKAGPVLTGVLLGLFVFGIGKAGVMPVHYWLPAAMVAPTPVSALLHAVAVVKAGVFTLTKVVVYVFGVENLASLGTADWLAWVAGFTILAASVVALQQDHLKRRLAYSTISQLSYIVLAAAILTPISLVGAAMHIAAHAVSKITLFFAAGSVHTAAHVDHISRMNGIGRRMPWTMGAFTVASLSMIGVPPTAGFLSKWFILEGAFSSGRWVPVAVIIGSTVLNASYFLPIVYRAFFREEEPHPAGAHGHHGHGEPHAHDTHAHGGGHGEAPLPMVIAIVVTASLTVLMFLFPGLPLGLSEAMMETRP
ncbi:monovalent cation/H+ antiporter subunit D family protein [Lutibaculum baratangense]|uniref:NADH-ubiquinone oxidoreductase chain L n=1 Tax=Lutibaculum baratangense AMV1 TaxID=631454 RepID=V4T831_9HYPH|nr:monovalent cation/H+ antiporter subunit D family protein [Lutibaculum baratangense]ESR22758.1 NADH-ubiquinone oxidoreductase chain L [Lutibaculum baratangense AMV1]